MVNSSEIYDIYAVRYAYSPERPASARFLRWAGPSDFFLTDEHDADCRLDFYVWVIRNDNRTVLVDTGFTRATSDRRGHHYLAEVGHLLDEISVNRESVKDVIVTHMHWDHAGNFDVCPSATLHIQEREMHFVAGRDMESALIRRPIHVDDVCAAVRLLHDGRLRCHRGEYWLAPGIFVTQVGGHTPGLQIVRVATKRGWVVLASDAVHYYANMELERPFPIIYDVAEYTRAWRTVAALADSPAHIIPGHDPLVMQRYPSLSRDLSGHIAVLSG